MSLAGLDSPNLLSPFSSVHFTSVKILSRIMLGPLLIEYILNSTVSVCREGIPSCKRIVSTTFHDFISAQS